MRGPAAQDGLFWLGCRRPGHYEAPTRARPGSRLEAPSGTALSSLALGKWTSLLCACVLVIVSLGFMPETALAAVVSQEQPLRFDEETPIVLGSTPSIAVLFNDTSTDFKLLRVEGSLDPDPAEADEEATPVPIEVDSGAGFAPLLPDAIIPATGRVRFRLAAPGEVFPSATGWLTVVARSGGQTIVVRRALAIEQQVPVPAVSGWTVISSQTTPWDHEGGEVGLPIPLKGNPACVDASAPSTVTADKDRTVAITSRCVAEGLQLLPESFPSAGTYKGVLKVGANDVALEVRRTFVIWWPISLILIGFLLALWAQGRLDQGWRVQQRWWLDRLPGRAAKADLAYAVVSDGMPWEKYELGQPLSDEVDRLKEQLSAIRRERPLLLRYLPWPDGFMMAEREAVRKGIASLDRLVQDWPGLPKVFARAQQRLSEKPYYPIRAKRLFERALVIVGAGGVPVAASELIARSQEAASLPNALRIVDDIDALDVYLGMFPPVQETPLDATTLARARQSERQASGALRELNDARRVVTEVGPLVEKGKRLALRLEVPRAPAVDEDAVKQQGALPREVMELPLLALRRIGEFATARSLEIGHTALILLTLSLGVWSGLEILYNDKVWGDSVGDFVAAVIWGFAASTVIAPVISAAKQLGTRPSDTAAPKSAT